MAINEQTTPPQKTGSFPKPTDAQKANADTMTNSDRLASTPDEIVPPQKQPDHPTKEEGDVVPSFAKKNSADLDKASDKKWDDKH